MSSEINPDEHDHPISASQPPEFRRPEEDSDPYSSSAPLQSSQPIRSTSSVSLVAPGLHSALSGSQLPPSSSPTATQPIFIQRPDGTDNGRRPLTSPPDSPPRATSSTELLSASRSPPGPTSISLPDVIRITQPTPAPHETSHDARLRDPSRNFSGPRPFSSPAPASAPQVMPLMRSTESYHEDSRYPVSPRRARLGSPLPPLPDEQQTELRVPPRTRTVDTHGSGRGAGLDWILPVEDKIPKLTIQSRLQPTLDKAIIERDKYATKAKMTGYALNIAIGLQVLLGSLTTGLSAAATAGHSAAIATTALGGLTTLVASYLARARGSNEPELSITRVKDLEQFIRECQAFILDYGHISTDQYDNEVVRFRSRFEELLGNASGERKLSPPV